MDFTPSPRAQELRSRVVAFLERHVYPVEADLAGEEHHVRAGVPYPPALVELRRRAKAEGLWNLFLPDDRYGAGLTNAEYAILCEEMGRTAAAPTVFF